MINFISELCFNLFPKVKSAHIRQARCLEAPQIQRVCKVNIHIETALQVQKYSPFISYSSSCSDLIQAKPVTDFT